MSFSDLNGLLKGSIVVSWLSVVLHVVLVATVLYWHFFDAANLTFKSWLKGILHLGTFSNDVTAIVIFCVLMLVQLVLLFLFTTWVSAGDKKAYYVVTALMLLGIWTYFLPIALALLGLLLPPASLAHFGMESFEDLF